MNKLIIALILGISLSACASHYGSARITSIPAGAQVMSDDGTVLGVTPTIVWWEDKNDDRQYLILRFSKEGYYEKVDSFWLSMRHKSQEDAMNNPQKMEVLLDLDN
jgi:hypothetical protein